MAAAAPKAGADSERTAEPALTAMVYPILHLKEIDVNLYQATKTVPPHIHVHSLHSYFLLAGDPTVPITYTVSRMRDGRSFSTRSVTASQRGRPIYSCVASFHTNEPNRFWHQYPMPVAPDPETLPSHETRMATLLADPRLPKQAHAFIRKAMNTERPIDLRYIDEPNPLDGPVTRPPRRMVWMRAKGDLGGEEANQTLHRCVVAYASDFMLLGTSLLPHGGHWYNPLVSMTVSLDHSMWFHAPFRADKWMLYVLESPRLEGSRSLSFGRLYTRDGVHAVTVAQEGLVRDKAEGRPASSEPKEVSPPTRPPAQGSHDVSGVTPPSAKLTSRL